MSRVKYRVYRFNLLETIMIVGDGKKGIALAKLKRGLNDVLHSLEVPKSVEEQET